jgi:hypothetical protein
MRIFQRDAVLYILVAFVAAGAGVLQAWIYGLPVPTIHDEFSYLFSGETFARGRWTNPTPPLWEHFETFHVLMQPTYSSKYPPGQGLFLAAGQLLGHPVIGVWLGMGLACGAGAYLLRAFVPRWWAIAGGLLMAVRLGLSKWGWNYWGGGVGFAGGALFIGGWARVMRKPRPLPAIVMASGLILIGTTRPLEGVLLCIPVGLATLVRIVWQWRRTRGALRAGTADEFWIAPPERKSQFPRVWKQVVFPALAVLIPAAFATGYHNYRVTGNVLRTPYMEYIAQYVYPPHLLILKPRADVPVYRFKEMEETQLHYLYTGYESQREDRAVWLDHVLYKLWVWQRLFLGYGLLIPLLVLPCVFAKSAKTRFVVVAAVFVFGFVATVHVWAHEHYVAPVAPLLYVLVVQGFRYIALARWGEWEVGRTLSVTLLVACLVVPLAKLVPQFNDVLPEPGPPSKTDGLLPHCGDWLLTELRDWLIHMPRAAWAVNRAQIEQSLKAEGGRHLVLVTYAEDHSIHDEWIYNQADIATAPVVWARPINRDGQERLERFFPDRTIWLIRVSQNDWSLQRLRKTVKRSS